MPHATIQYHNYEEQTGCMRISRIIQHNSEDVGMCEVADKTLGVSYNVQVQVPILDKAGMRSAVMRIRLRSDAVQEVTAKINRLFSHMYI